MLYLASYRGFSIFNIPFPVNGIVRYPGQFAGAAIYPIVNLCKVFVFCDFRTLLDAEIAGISVHYLVIFPE